MKNYLPLALAAALSIGIPMAAHGQAFPLEFCGDPPLEGKATWYPVFTENMSLQQVQEQFCRDAFATQYRGRSLVQIGSFSDRQRAAIFADRVGGVVGDPYSWGTDTPDTLAPPIRSYDELPENARQVFGMYLYLYEREMFTNRAIPDDDTIMAAFFAAKSLCNMPREDWDPFLRNEMGLYLDWHNSHFGGDPEHYRNHLMSIVPALVEVQYRSNGDFCDLSHLIPER